MTVLNLKNTKVFTIIIFKCRNVNFTLFPMCFQITNNLDKLLVNNANSIQSSCRL